MSHASGLLLVLQESAATTPTDTAPPVLISAASSVPLFGGNIPNGAVLTLTFSEPVEGNTAFGAISQTQFNVQPAGIRCQFELHPNQASGIEWYMRQNRVVYRNS